MTTGSTRNCGREQEGRKTAVVSETLRTLSRTHARTQQLMPGPCPCSAKTRQKVSQSSFSFSFKKEEEEENHCSDILVE